MLFMGMSIDADIKLGPLKVDARFLRPLIVQ
jgi:hypothetical protein